MTSNIYLVTGSDTVTARKKFIELKKSFTGANFLEIDLSSITNNELAEKLQLTDMFSQTVFIFVNFSLTNAQTWQTIEKNLSSSPAIFEAVGKNIGRIPPTLKKKMQIFNVDARTEIFNLLNSLTPQKASTFINLLELNLADTAEPIVMTMIQNRIRDLIVITTSPDSFNGQPWQKNQLVSQAKTFTLSQLIRLYRKLLSIEIREKSSSNPDLYSQHFMVELVSI